MERDALSFRPVSARGRLLSLVTPFLMVACSPKIEQMTDGTDSGQTTQTTDKDSDTLDTEITGADQGTQTDTDTGETETFESDTDDEPVCGNGVVEEGEACDTDNLNGNTCELMNFDGGGELLCTNCDINTSECICNKGITCEKLLPSDYEVLCENFEGADLTRKQVEDLLATAFGEPFENCTGEGWPYAQGDTFSPLLDIYDKSNPGTKEFWQALSPEEVVPSCGSEVRNMVVMFPYYADKNLLVVNDTPSSPLERLPNLPQSILELGFCGAFAKPVEDLSVVVDDCSGGESSIDSMAIDGYTSMAAVSGYMADMHFSNPILQPIKALNLAAYVNPNAPTGPVCTAIQPSESYISLAPESIKTCISTCDE